MFIPFEQASSFDVVLRFSVAVLMASSLFQVGLIAFAVFADEGRRRQRFPVAPQESVSVFESLRSESLQHPYDVVAPSSVLVPSSDARSP